MLSSRRGVTLIELIVVVAIVVILATLTPMLTSAVVLDRRIYNSGTQVQQDIMLVRDMAITHSSGGPSSLGGTRFLMRLYLEENALAYQLSESTGALPVSHPVPSSDVVVRTLPSAYGFPASSGLTSPPSVVIGAASVTSGYVDVVFDDQGLAYWAVDGGAFQQTTGSIILVSSTLSKEITVDVSPIGRVTLAWVKR